MSKKHPQASMASPHLVVVPLPLYGHISPMLRLSLQLASLGNKVTFIASGRTQAATLSAFESSLSHIDDAETVRSGLSFEFIPDEDSVELEQGGEEGLWAVLRWMSAQHGTVDQIVESSVSRHGQISCVILDFLALHLRDVADKHNASVALFWTPSPPWLLLCLQVKAFVDGGYAPLTPSNALSTVSGLTGVPALCNYMDVPTALLKPRDQQLERTLELAQYLIEAPWVIVNTIPELDSQSLACIRQLGVKLVTLGPLLPMDDPVAPDDLPILSWLHEKPPLSVLYICFGTLAEHSAEQLQELASALEELNQNLFFLWALRRSQQPSLSEEFQRRTSARGMVVPWCSQLQILKHPSIGGFVTHCGWNSILESLSCGVPLVGWPSIAEQSLNAKYLVDVWKVGARIISRNPDASTRFVTQSEISDAIATVMIAEEGREMRRRARDIQKAADRAMRSSLVEARRWAQSFKSAGK
ncbi:UDP-glycosyltransferase 85A5 [Selaginella moellendorffii]|nr:UDP-glycosyltransferase 85A5 [Selaginella moellendorffii]|eukprot:XP_024514796.1 UDP-glycosyltransferase 85A5 [Selaginella moellendorffii]